MRPPYADRHTSQRSSTLAFRCHHFSTAAVDERAAVLRAYLATHQSRRFMMPIISGAGLMVDSSTRGRAREVSGMIFASDYFALESARLASMFNASPNSARLRVWRDALAELNAPCHSAHSYFAVSDAPAIFTGQVCRDFHDIAVARSVD